MKKNQLLLLLSLLISVAGMAQGVTRSAVSGKITDNTNTPVLGAQVVMVDVNSGSLYGAVTDEDGYYRISNVKPGGPYKFSAIYVGFTDYVVENVYLQLGETKNIDGQLSEDVSQLDEVVITTSKSGVFSSKRTGAATAITQSDINKIPQASRSVADFVRLTPQAQITEGDDGFSISIGGQNNRFNSIYIDGAVSNDVFGLAGSGTNGGQTGVNPFSVDAIESYSVQVAPFDVRVSGFAGGAISAITRSGSNNWEGSVYSFIRNEDLAGKTPVSLAEDEPRERLGDFSTLTSGIRIGGPIIKDKLFFFVNYERGESNIPQPFNISNYNGNATNDDINRLRNFISNQFNYDIGNFETPSTLESHNFTAKIDANINKNNTFSFKYNLISADNLEGRSSSRNQLGFGNGSELFNSTTNTLSAELNSSFGNKFANSLILGYTNVRDDRDPSGPDFPSVRIRDGLDGRFDGISFGAEPFSTANLLDQDVFTLTDNFEIFLGKHALTIGTHHEFYKVKNLFFAFNYGNYTYNTTDDFVNQVKPDFIRFFSLNDLNVGDESSGAAEFKNSQHGIYFQDEFRITDNFRVTGGVRIDVPVWENGPSNSDFNEDLQLFDEDGSPDGVQLSAANELEANGKNLRGARVGKKIKSKVHFSPRFGFNWDVSGNRTTQIRGGAGIFTSRIPLVWPAASYNNNGVTQGGTFFLPDGENFNPNINEQFIPADIKDKIEKGEQVFNGNIDLFVPDLKLPQVAKYNIAIDQKIPVLGGLILSTDFIYNNTINGIRFENLNIRGQLGEDSRIFNGGGIDRRPLFSRDRVISQYGAIILGSNTNKGESWNASVTIQKPFQNGFTGQLGYSYGDSRSVFDGNSSRNITNWERSVTINGKNNTRIGRSEFAQGHRVFANVSYQFDWAKNFKTTVSLFYDGTQGQPTSYIYRQGRDENNRDITLLGDTSDDDNALLFVPASRDQINLVPFERDGRTVSADEQYADLEEFINGNDYLKTRKGKFAERNGDFGPWSHVIDLRILQDFNLKLGNKKHTFQLSADIFNFTNLLNKKWGERNRFVRNTTSVITVAKNERITPDMPVSNPANPSGPALTNGSIPEFNFDKTRVSNDRIEGVDDAGIQSSRWQMQVGLRYIFK
ncbi:TonB-dependent receptor [Aquimarina agarivorans]|uniref:TonB-dependent receptor n=1 Tax=Aquimarina agarivorans TaxID=980584 RepID=UPI000248FB50|nr:TonB-dependent receptor [Aquimarina agarivorans]